MTADIDVSTNIDFYFEQIVHDAIVSRQVEATDAAQHYLVGLLSDYARGEQPGALDRPLTFQLRDALEARGAERFQRLRSIGDGVLYLLGFFSDSLTRRGADRRYVMKVGSSAYGHASAMLRMGGSANTVDVLDELARKYDGFVAVVRDVADGVLTSVRDDTALLQVYERWQRTGSTRLAQRLVSSGLCPVKGGEDLN